MARSYKKAHPYDIMTMKRYYDIAKEIEYRGYFLDCTCVYGIMYESVDSFLNEKFGKRRHRFKISKKTITVNNLGAWLQVCGVKPIDLRVIKSRYTQKKKTAWRLSFRKNYKFSEYDKWDSEKYPKLKSMTWLNF